MNHFPHDDAMPGLAHCFDGDGMLQTLRDAFGVDWASARPNRLRYRAGQQVVVQFEVSPANGIDCVSAILCAEPGRARRMHVKAGSRHTRFADSHQMYLQAFPHDRKLPELAAISDGTALKALNMNADTPRLMRYRAGLAATFRAETRDGAVFIKHTSEPVAPPNAALLHWLARAVDGKFRVPQPAMVSPSGCVLAVQGDAGTPLSHLLPEAADPQAHRLIERAATALAHLHALSTRGLPDGVRVFDRAHLAQNMHRVMSLLVWANPALQSKLECISQTALAVLVHKVWPVALIHGDMKLDHIFDDGAGIGLIDMDSCAQGHPLMDVAALIARIHGAVAQGTMTALKADGLMGQFVEAYQKQYGCFDHDALRAFTALSLIENAAGSFRNFHKDWRTAQGRLVDCAAEQVCAIDGLRQGTNPSR